MRNIYICSQPGYANVALLHIFSLFLLVASQSTVNTILDILIREKRCLFFFFLFPIVLLTGPTSEQYIHEVKILRKLVTQRMMVKP